MSNIVPTHEMIKNLADYIVNGMSFQELTQFVYDDVYSIIRLLYSRNKQRKRIFHGWIRIAVNPCSVRTYDDDRPPAKRKPLHTNDLRRMLIANAVP